MKIVLATSNPNKVQEINAITNDMGIEFILPPEGFNPLENADKFEDNAIIKAREAYRLTNMPVLADDSGLCVDVLNGSPGVHSARYAETPQGRIDRLLSNLRNVPYEKRTVKFVCAMVLLSENGEVDFLTCGECFGKIAFGQKGQNGFGYDPVFVVNDGDLTMAELSEEEKNKISHRAIALTNVIDYIKSKYQLIH